MSVGVTKARMDVHEVHVTPPPPHVDLIHELEPIVGQNRGQGALHAVSQIGLHIPMMEPPEWGEEECQKSQIRGVASKVQLGALSGLVRCERQPNPGHWSQGWVPLIPTQLSSALARAVGCLFDCDPLIWGSASH
jgi:hypothetical protein